MTYKEELEWSDLFSPEELLSFPSTRTNKHQIEAVYSNWKSLHWVCLRVSKTTNRKGWHNYTWYLPKKGGRKWTDTTQRSLKLHSSLFSVWFLKGLNRNPIYFEVSVGLWWAFWGQGETLHLIHNNMCIKGFIFILRKDIFLKPSQLKSQLKH